MRLSKIKIMNELSNTIENVNKQIVKNTNADSLYSRGLASEGFLGGYRQALNDVILFINCGGKINSKGWF